MSFSKLQFSSTIKGDATVISNGGKLAKWKRGGNIKCTYMINEHPLLADTEVTLEVLGKHYTRYVVGFTTMNPNKMDVNHCISPRGKIYSGVERTTCHVNIKRRNNTVYVKLNEAVKKEKTCTAKEIWIVVGVYYGNGRITLKNNAFEVHNQWKFNGGNVELLHSGIRLKDWNSGSYVCVPTSKGVGMVISIRPIKKDRGHFVTVNKFDATKSYENETRGVLSVCENIVTLKNINADLKIEVRSNGEIFYFWGNKRGSTTANAGNDLAIVFELFNTQLTMSESYIIDERENGSSVQAGTLVTGLCVDSEISPPSSFSSSMDLEDDYDNENDEHMIQPKPHSHNVVILSEISENDTKTNVDLSITSSQKEICFDGTYGPQKQENKHFITSIYTKLVKELEPYPFCDHLVEKGFMSMDDNNHIMRIKEHKPRPEVIRSILSILAKSNITEESLNCIFGALDLSHLVLK